MFLADVTFLMGNGFRLAKSKREPPLRVTVMIRDSDRNKNNSARNLVEVVLFENWGVPQARGAGRISDPQILPYVGPGFLLAGTELHSEIVHGQYLVQEHRQVWHVVPR
ncbi:MAG TPA: hypothetical protein VN280_22500 [Variovorax sp.]|nr:hypothetical protein [Variovorax sp.]